jgi:hypothetical protein
MRTTTQTRVSLPDPSFPLLEASDLPGADDWSMLESLRFDDLGDSDDDRFATVTFAPSFDD